ncbi:A/G-specific adenine glycosylase [bacterium]|nr:A/G-specific adenine glycosylase [bacterium]
MVCTVEDHGLTSSSCAYFRRKLLSWYGENARRFAWRRTRNPYHILVAEVLLQQTDAKKAASIYDSFLAAYPTPGVLAKARQSAVLRYVARIGLDYRAGRLIRIARAIMANHGGRVPRDRGELLALPGVGPYMANAVLFSAFGCRLAVLDTNVVRVIARFFALTSKRSRPRTDPALWKVAADLLPRRRDLSRTWNYALLDFAALVCRHHRPRCVSCTCRRRCCYLTGL